MLERIRRQRAPHLEALPLTTDPAVLARAAARAADASFSQQLRDAEQAAARLGADLPHSTVLAPVAGLHDWPGFDVESHRETRHASKLMARLYGALEKAYPITYFIAGTNPAVSL